jgi:uncharacterized protein
MDTTPEPSSSSILDGLVEIKEVDCQHYRGWVRDFLPDELVDIHTHIWRASDFPNSTAETSEQRAVTWPARVALENPIEHLMETYRLLLPDKRVTPLLFATLPAGGNLDVQNDYVMTCANQVNAPALIFSDPAWSAAELEARVLAGGFCGAKSYLTLAPAYLPAAEIRIFDFFPPHQLEIHDRHGWIVMLHIPRNARLRDAVNLAQLLQIEHNYPRLRLIVAHVGRAYSNEDVGNAFEALAETKHLCFDISANTNETVFEQLLRCVGPKRVLFGTDLPILRMRMRRITQAGRYINIVPKGLYGDISDDRNMGEVEGAEAEQLTFFLYEELAAFRRAAKRVGLSRSDLEDVFCNNARRLLAGAAG